MYNSTDTWGTWTRAYYYDSPTSTTSTTSAADASTVWSTWTGAYYYDSPTSTTSATNTSTVWSTWTGRVTGDISNFGALTRTPQLCDVDVEEHEIDIGRAGRTTHRDNPEFRSDPDYVDPKEKSEEVAKELLRELIGEEQARVYEETGRVLVHGKKYDYIIQKRGFIRRIEPGKIVDLCVHLEHRHAYPDTDNVISMLFMLKHRENDVLEMANEHYVHEGAEVPKCARAA